ncbi:MAG: hypothetical protein ING19_08080 [Azospirillum sp.]|nr:hypothetical protein [Azospirillum sp.]
MQILFASAIGFTMVAIALAMSSPRADAFDGMADARAMNLAVYHQAATRAAVAAGGASFSGPLTGTSIATELPSWFAPMQDWRAAADAGFVATCLLAIPSNLDVGKTIAALFVRSANDPGAGAAVSGNFRSISGLSTSLNGTPLPLACAPGSPVYVSRIS